MRVTPGYLSVFAFPRSRDALVNGTLLSMPQFTYLSSADNSSSYLFGLWEHTSHPGFTALTLWTFGASSCSAAGQSCAGRGAASLPPHPA